MVNSHRSGISRAPGACLGYALTPSLAPSGSRFRDLTHASSTNEAPPGGARPGAVSVVLRHGSSRVEDTPLEVAVPGSKIVLLFHSELFSNRRVVNIYGMNPRGVS
jgi:hypothetical protein